MDYIAAGATDVGCVREKNEDSFLLDEPIGLYIVADGMGGHVGGKMASSLAVKSIQASLKSESASWQSEDPNTNIEDSAVPEALGAAVRAACATIFDRGVENESLSGMGTTVTAVILRGPSAFIGHVGDSRCYIQRGPRVVQITDDHSLVNEQVKAGLITEEQGASSGMRNIITRSVGFERDVAVDTYAATVEAGDRVLICSDGLSNLVDDMEIGEEMAKSPPEETVRNLIELARVRGGDDNITVLCIALSAEMA